MRSRHRGTVQPRHAVEDDSAVLGGRESAVLQANGDPTTEEGRTLLHDRSPLFKADAIRKPLLIGQVPTIRESTKPSPIKSSPRWRQENPVTYVLFPDEGHGFARPENSIAFTAVAEQFLGQCPAGGSSRSATR